VSIGIAALPTDVSFQGMPPDTTGMVLQVLWSTGNIEFVEAKDFTSKGFYPVPGYCDIPSTDTASTSVVDTTNGSVGGFKIAHSGSVTSSGDFKVPAVIPLTELHMNVKRPLEWYSDQGPDYSKLELQAFYKWNEPADGNWTTASLYSGETLANSKSSTIPMNAGYPYIDQTKVQTRREVSAIVGERTNGFARPTVSTAFNNNGGLAFEAKFSLDSYYRLAQVEFDTASTPADFFAYDDEAEKYKGLSVQDSVARDDMFALLTKTQPKFKLTYDNGTTRTIGFNEFYANVRNAILRETSNDVTVNDIFDSAGPTTYERETLNSSFPGYNADPSLDTSYEVLYVNPDAEGDAIETWVFSMKYVPKEYGSGVYNTQFRVYLPVFSWEEEFRIERKLSSNVRLDWQSSQYGAVFGSSGYDVSNPALHPNGDTIAAIQDAWKMVGRYSRRGVYKERDMKFMPNMFNYAVSGQTAVNLKGWERTGYPNTISAQIDLGKLGTPSDVYWDRDWPLPVLYRRYRATEDDTVQVDLRYQKQ